MVAASRLAPRLEETILNMCYARYPLENENA